LHHSPERIIAKLRRSPYFVELIQLARPRLPISRELPCREDYVVSLGESSSLNVFEHLHHLRDFGTIGVEYPEAPRQIVNEARGDFSTGVINRGAMAPIKDSWRYANTTEGPKYRAQVLIAAIRPERVTHQCDRRRISLR